MAKISKNLVLITVTLAIFVNAGTAWADPKKEESFFDHFAFWQKHKSNNQCKSIFERYAPILGIVVSLAAIPIVVTRVQSKKVDAPYIGFGIYFDWDRMIEKLSVEERNLLQDPSKNQEAIIKMFNSKLSGGRASEDGKDGNINWETIILNPNEMRYASEYLDPEVKDRGVCRHKATILFEICNKLGLKAKLLRATATDPDTKKLEKPQTFSHVYVYLPDFETIADPTNDEYMSANKYRSEFQITQESNFDLTRKLRGTYTP